MSAHEASTCVLDEELNVAAKQNPRPSTARPVSPVSVAYRICTRPLRRRTRTSRSAPAQCSSGACPAAGERAGSLAGPTHARHWQAAQTAERSCDARDRGAPSAADALGAFCCGTLEARVSAQDDWHRDLAVRKV
jgi:hypothetical protein